jgi:GDP-D-mannose 3',5'-epimerase
VRSYKLDASRGVAGRNSDNTMIKQILDWEPNIPLRRGLEEMYTWIEHQYQDHKAGKRTIS